MKLTSVTLASLLVSFSAHATNWSYGCVGSLPNGDRLTYDRFNLVILSKTLANGAQPNTPAEDKIQVFQAENANTGFQRNMNFNIPYSSVDPAHFGELRLTEISSRRIDPKDFRYIKTYDVELRVEPYISVTPLGRAELRCYENEDMGERGR
jgi:hypothetical protein